MSKPELKIELCSQSGQDLSALFASLEQVSKVSLDACLEVKQLVVGDSVSLHKDIVYFGLVTAPGTGHVSLELRVREQFRERATALIAAYL